MTADLTLSRRQRIELGLPEPTPSDPVRAWRVTRARLQVWLWRHRLSLAVVSPLVVLAGVLRLWGLAGGSAFADDEGTYVAQAWAVQTQHGLAPYTYWYDHPPLGWIQLSGWTWLTHAFHPGATTIVNARGLMVILAMLDAALIFILARRLGMSRLAAGVATGLWASCPLAVGMSRMVYLDNLAVPWILAALVLAATPKRNLWSHVGSGICFAIAVLSKETSVLILPAVIYLVWHRSARQTRAFCMAGFGSSFGLVVIGYPLLATLKGELLPGSGHVSLVEALKFQFLSRPSTGSLLVSSSKSRGVLSGWLALDGFLLAGAIIAVVLTLRSSQLRSVGIALGVLLLAGVRPGYLPQPFVIEVLPIAALAVAGAGGELGRRLRTNPQRSVHGIGLVSAAAVILLAVLVVAPTWWRHDRQLGTANVVRPTIAAETWLTDHHQEHALLVDDTMWTDLILDGYPRNSVIWFYKLDYLNNLDPSVRQRIGSYKDFGVVVSTPVIRAALQNSSTSSLRLVRDALAHSTVIATFGTGGNRTEIRRVTP